MVLITTKYLQYLPPCTNSNPSSTPSAQTCPFMWHLLCKEGGSSVGVMTDLFIFLTSRWRPSLNVYTTAIVSIHISQSFQLPKHISHCSVETLVQVVAVCAYLSYSLFSKLTSALQCHTDGDNCLIVSRTSSPGLSYIKVWHHTQPSVGLLVSATTPFSYSSHSHRQW